MESLFMRNLQRQLHSQYVPKLVLHINICYDKKTVFLPFFECGMKIKFNLHHQNHLVVVSKNTGYPSLIILSKNYGYPYACDW